MTTSSPRENVPEDDEPRIGLVRCAELGAILVHFKAATRAEVLERLTVDAADYETSRRHWTRAMVSQLEDGDESLTKQFGTAFAEKREELVASEATLESLGPRRQLQPLEVPVAPALPSLGSVDPGAAPVTTPVLASPVAPAPAPASEVARPLAMPSYLRASSSEPVAPTPAPVQAAPPAVIVRRPMIEDLNPDETAPIGPVNVGAILPFEGTTGDETLQALFARSPVEASPSPSSENPDPDETVMLPPTHAVSSGAGMKGLRATAVPIISVDEYAELRAHLLVFGEDHEPTLKRFGLLSSDSRELLKLRFLSAFSIDESLRDRFVAKMQQLAAELRSK